MAEPQNPIINRVAPSWANLVATASDSDTGALIETSGVQELDFSSSVERAQQKSGGVVIAESQGDLSHSARMKLYFSGARQLITGLADVAQAQGFQIGDVYRVALVRFNLHVQFELPTGDEVFDYVLNGCAISEDAFSGKEGPEVLTENFPLSVMQIYRILPDGRKVSL